MKCPFCNKEMAVLVKDVKYREFEAGMIDDPNSVDLDNYYMVDSYREITYTCYDCNKSFNNKGEEKWKEVF